MLVSFSIAFKHKILTFDIYYTLNSLISYEKSLAQYLISAISKKSLTAIEQKGMAFDHDFCQFPP